MNINTQELDAFLIEAQLINQKVKALAQNNASTQDIDELIKKRGEDKKRRQDAQLRRESQAVERKIKGREGKGITKDFANFCRHCHIQFQLQTAICWKCNRPTMTLGQRQEMLKGMVYDYKHNKTERSQKRQKWEMFQKTRAALWKKSSINYNQKWDYFVEDSDQEVDKEPILPKDDPNFKALEMDMLERKKKRTKDTENAKRIKDKGNAAMKEGDYLKASQMYTLALEHVKDMKSIYTNRALAYIKLRKYKKAIKDCSNVIEFMEVFEKVGENKDLMFKALSRRAIAQKERKEYKEALEDVNQALKLFSNDGPALLLKKEIQGFVAHSETVEKLRRQSLQNDKKEADIKEGELKETEIKEQESDADEEQKSKQIQKDIVKQLAESELADQTKKQQQKKIQIKKPTNQPYKQLDAVKEIPVRLKELNQDNVEYLIQTLLRKKEFKSIFVASNGIQTALNHIVAEESPRNEVLLVYMCLEGEGVGEKRVWDWGVHKIYDIILSKFQGQGKLNFSVYGYVDNLFQILVPMSLSDTHRPQLSADPSTYNFLETLFPKLITKYKKQPMLLDNYLTFFSNLCSGQSVLKNQFLKPQRVKVIYDSLYHFVLSHKSKNRELLDLKQSVYSFIANIITNVEHRKVFIQFIKNDNKIQQIRQELELYPRSAHNFDGYIENVLSVTANAFMESQVEAVELSEVLFDRYVKNWQNYSQTIVYRSLLTIGRVKYSDNKMLPKWMKTFDKMAIKVDPLNDQPQNYLTQVIKILNILFSLNSNAIITIPQNLMSLLCKLVKENNEHEQLFCNTCNLVGILIDKKNVLSEAVYVWLRGTIARLVEIAKQRVGNWRKSAAILLGKSSGDPRCRQELTTHHGMDVLKSIASFVLDKK